MYIMIKLIHILVATDKIHKYTAIFEKDGKRLKVHFGATGYNDYIKYSKTDAKIAKSKKDAYIARHSVRENFNDPLTAGALSRWILWNKETLQDSIADYKRRFNF